MDGTAYVVISDPGGDPWEEAVCATRDEAEAVITRILDGIAAHGLDPAEWRPLLWVEPRPA